MSDRFLDQLNANLDRFLAIWTDHMREAGYLAHTTAKREDCIESFQGVLLSIRHLTEGAGIPGFAAMLKKSENQAQFMVTSAARHRQRGVTEGMFLGCFKTLIHSLEDIVLTLDIGNRDKLEAILKIRRVCDVLETVFVSDWERADIADVIRELQDVNRQLTLKKNRYENIFQSTSDLVLLVDDQGLITESNPETERYLASQYLLGRPFWDFLDLQCRNIDEVLEAFPCDIPHEISSRDGRYVFSLRIVPLSRVSLATPGHMLILSDITLLANHRQELESRVAERTADLIRSQDLLRQEKAQTDEMNVTLRNVMKSIESERRDLEQKISSRISANLLPALEKVREESVAGTRDSYLDLIQEQLIALTAGFDSELDAGMLKLSKTELRICHFIQAGCSTKEISEAMNLAFDTIRTHRKNIRKKLGLQGKDVNMHTYLSNRNCTPLDAN